MNQAAKAVTPAVRETRRHAKEQLEMNWQQLLQRSFAWLLVGDNLEKKLEKSPLHHISIALGTAQDKIALLHGEPSVLVGVQDRQKLDELLPALKKEIERRSRGGGAIILKERSVEVTAPPQEQPPVQATAILGGAA